MADRRRVFKVGERVREIIAHELNRLSDPRFELVTISSVMTTRDLKMAKVYWLTYGGKERIEEISEAFESATGVFRSAVGKALKLRYAPELKFFYDDTLDEQERVDRLFMKLNNPDQS